jgi:hypothetical protein
LQKCKKPVGAAGYAAEYEFHKAAEKEKTRLNAGRFHMIPPTLSQARQLRRLDGLRATGQIRPCSTDAQVALALDCTKFGIVQYRTNDIELACAGKLSCFDAALVHATACTMQVLGIVPLEPSAAHGLAFSTLNRRLQESTGVGEFFQLTKCAPQSNPNCLIHLQSKPCTHAPLVQCANKVARGRHGLPCLVWHCFEATKGIFIIDCLHYHIEDIDYADSEGIPHYIVYNAETRVLFLYPEVQSL